MNDNEYISHFNSLWFLFRNLVEEENVPEDVSVAVQKAIGEQQG